MKKKKKKEKTLIKKKKKKKKFLSFRAFRSEESLSFVTGNIR